MPDRINGETEEQWHKKSVAFFNEVIDNTLGKELPPVQISDIHNKAYNIRDLIQVKTVFIASNIHCSYGTEGLEEDYPKAIKLILNKHKEIKFYCLIIRDSMDYKSSDLFYHTLENLAPYYSDVFWLDVKNSQKLNLFANPTRIIVDKNMIVTNIGFGINLLHPVSDELELEINE